MCMYIFKYIYDSVSEGLPSSENGRGVLLSTLHYDSEACVKRH